MHKILWPPLNIPIGSSEPVVVVGCRHVTEMHSEDLSFLVIFTARFTVSSSPISQRVYM